MRSSAAARRAAAFFCFEFDAAGLLPGAVTREAREVPRAGELTEWCRSWVHSPLTLPATLLPLVAAAAPPREDRC